jgi:predicted MPP superfamily phosphohydrolase
MTSLFDPITLRSVTVPLLPSAADPLRVLHLSDLHLTPHQSRKREWVRSLAALEPDLVVDTGDNLAHLDALLGLRAAFVDLEIEFEGRDAQGRGDIGPGSRQRG